MAEKRQKEPEVQLAFVAKPEEEEEDDRNYLLAEFLPSKVGGKLSWIGGLLPAMEAEKRSCGSCGDVMQLLVQLYAPLDHINPDAFHRIVLVLACPRPACHHKDGSLPFKVMRVQLPRENPYVVPELDEVSDEEEDEEAMQRCPDSAFAYLTDEACEVCGWYAKKRCGKCRAVRYCSKQHQVAHWKAGHGDACDKLEEKVGVAASAPPMPVCRRRNVAVSDSKGIGCFKEIEICTEPEGRQISQVVAKMEAKRIARLAAGPSGGDEEEEDEGDEDEEHLKELEEQNEELMKKYEENLKQYQGEEFDEESWKLREGPDRNFAVFQRTVAHNPDQVLRYAFGGTPLWISCKSCLPQEEKKEEVAEKADCVADEKEVTVGDEAAAKPAAAQEGASATIPPPCPLCGEPRVFELQVMPQLLYFLGVKEQFQKQSVDWGTLVVYSCAKSCSLPAAKEGGQAYAEEFLWRQQQ